MRWLHPSFLWLWLLIPPLIASSYWLGRRQAISFSSLVPLLGRPRGRAPWIRGLRAALSALALFFLVAALAGPWKPSLADAPRSEGASVMFVLDVSGSMAEGDMTWFGEPVPRLQVLKEFVRLFVLGGTAENGERLPGRPDDRFGAVVFASRPESLCPLTFSHETLIQLLDQEQPRSVPTESQSNIGDALAWGLHRLEAGGATRPAIILISDGEQNTPFPALKPGQAAQLAASRGVPVYCLDLGQAGGDTNETSVKEAGEKAHSGRLALQAVARISGGRCYSARDLDAVSQVCGEIDRLERERFSRGPRMSEDKAAPFCAAALACIILLEFLRHTAWQRIP